MNPIIEKLGDRPKEWLQKVNDRRKELVQRGSEIVSDLQDLQERLVEKGQHALHAGQKAVLGFEENVLLKVSDLLDKAHSLTGARSAALKRSAEYVSERLEEVREQIKAEAAEVVEKASDEAAEATEAAPVAEAAAKATADETPARAESNAVKAEEAAALPQPFPGYDEYSVKKLNAKLAELDRVQLEAARAYEQATRSRKTILDNLDRLLSDAHARN